MAREYARLNEYFMPLHEMEPPSLNYQQYLQQSSESGPPAYELTAGRAGGGAGADLGVLAGLAPQLPPAHSTQHAMRNKKTTQYNSDSYDNMSGCESVATASSVVSASSTRKRKASSFGTASVCDDDGDDARSSRTLPDKKQNHSEIEKRRRDKMNTYISELSAMVPMCGAMARKLDKLTVLRMAVQHLRTVRGALSACPLTVRPRPAFLSQRELNALILNAASDCFLLVVGCDRGRLLYASASVKKMLHYDQSELLGQSLFDILHPKDVAKVKEQLSSSDLSPRERFIDAKTMLPVKAEVVAGVNRLCPGARRSFFCRIKCKAPSDAPPVKQEHEHMPKMRKKHPSDKKYCVVQCTGYLKSWGPCEGPGGTEGGEEGEASNLSCLVAVARALPDLTAAASQPTRHLQFVSRLAPDGKFLFVDQRVTLALGFLPQELLGTSLYEYMSGPELSAVARAHKSALLSREPLHTPPYSFRRKDGTHARIQTHFKPFKNPWTKDVESLVANNTVIADGQALAHADSVHASFDLYKQNTDVEMQRLIESQVESHKIGSAIAEEALRRSSTEFSTDLPADLLQDTVFNQQASLVDDLVGAELDYEQLRGGGPLAGYGQVRNNVALSSAGASATPPRVDSPPAPSPPLGLDGNGEAAMAVIMSLLEADAGLGGPVNFSGLPWPLP